MTAIGECLIYGSINIGGGGVSVHIEWPFGGTRNV